MKEFKINDHMAVICEWKKTRSAFKHEAILMIDGEEVDRVKICYLNRTWERYEFESVLQKMLNKTSADHYFLTPEEIKECLNKWEAGESAALDRQFKTIGAIAKMGEVLTGGDQKASNDWKTRMLKAGLEGRGLIMPEDWDGLDEATKEQRLNAVIAELNK